MLHHDHTASDALRALSFNNPTGSLSRRRFLQTLLAGAGTAVAASAILPEGVGALIPRPTLPTDGVLVIVNLAGGNDGLNTVVPFTDPAYFAKRPEIAFQPDEVLPITDSLGLHPNLPFLQSQYAAKRVAIVQGVGFTNPAEVDFSHFVQMAKWMRGWGGQGTPGTGWVGRWLDTQGGNNLLNAVHIGRGVPLHLVGAQRRAVSVPTAPGFGANPAHSRIYQSARSLADNVNHSSVFAAPLVKTLRDQLDVAATSQPIYASPFAGPSQVVKDFEAAARLINAGVGVRVVSITLGGFDHHASQRSTNIYDRGQHILLAELNQGLELFWSTLNTTMSAKTTLMTFSEFGRRIIGNGSKGTDHGAASCMFVMGPHVRSGLHGAHPSLTDTLPNDQLLAQYDFRQVYSSIIGRWLGGDAKEILGANYSPVNLFKGFIKVAEEAQPVDRSELPIERSVDGGVALLPAI